MACQKFMALGKWGGTQEVEYHTGRKEGCAQRKDGTNVRRREEIQGSGMGSILTVWSCSCHGCRPR